MEREGNNRNSFSHKIQALTNFNEISVKEEKLVRINMILLFFILEEHLRTWRILNFWTNVDLILKMCVACYNSYVLMDEIALVILWLLQSALYINFAINLWLFYKVVWSDQNTIRLHNLEHLKLTKLFFLI